MVEPLRHRQTKGAETDMPGLPPPRHISTLLCGSHRDADDRRGANEGWWPRRCGAVPILPKSHDIVFDIEASAMAGAGG